MRRWVAAGVAVLAFLVCASAALAGTDVNTWCASNGRDTFCVAEEDRLFRYESTSGEWRPCLDRNVAALVWIDDEALYCLSDPEGAPPPEEWMDERGEYCTIRYDIATGRATTVISFSLGGVRTDGRYLYWLSAPDEISRCDMDGRDKRVLVRGGERISGFRLAGGDLVTTSGEVYDAEGRARWGALGIPPDEIRFLNGSALDYRADEGVNGVRIKRLFTERWIDGDQPICFADDGLYTVRYSEDPDKQAAAEANEIWFYGGDASAPRLVCANGANRAVDICRANNRLYMTEPSFHDYLNVYELDERSGEILNTFAVDGLYTRMYQAGGQLFFYDPTAGYDIWFTAFHGIYNPLSPVAQEGEPDADDNAGDNAYENADGDTYENVDGEAYENADDNAYENADGDAYENADGDPDEDAPLRIEYEATSTLDEDKAYRVENAFDGDLATAWVEGMAGNGIGEGIYVIGNRHATLRGFSIYGGYGKSKDLYKKNARVKRLTVYADSEKIQTFTLKDERKTQHFTLDEPADGLVFLFEIDAVYPGGKYEDTCVSELSLTLQ